MDLSKDGQNMYIISISYGTFFLLLICTIFLSNVDKHKIFGSTFYRVWWLSKSEENITPADARIIYTYPDRVVAGSPFHVGVTLEYINDMSARSSWIVFSNVAINIRQLDHSIGKVVAYSSSDTSRAIVKGDAYSHSFSLRLPNSLSPGKYLVFLKFHAFFSPEAVGTNTDFQFNGSSYYNNSKGPAQIKPTDLPPIEVSKQNQTSSKGGQLNVEIQKPYSLINPKGSITVIIANSTKDNMPNPTINGIAHFSFKHSGNYTVTVPHVIPIHNNMVTVPPVIPIHNITIGAKFLGWSDGWHNPTSGKCNLHNLTSGKCDWNRRVQVSSGNYTDLYAIYDIYYYLSVLQNNFWIPQIFNGGGWYNAGSEAHFEASLMPIFGFIFKFDHWKSDNYTQLTSDYTNPTGSLKMDGPKQIIATWKWDYDNIGIVMTAIIMITAVATIMGKSVLSYLKKKINPRQKKMKDFI